MDEGSLPSTSTYLSSANALREGIECRSDVFRFGKPRGGVASESERR